MPVTIVIKSLNLSLRTAIKTGSSFPSDDLFFDTGYQ
jgi:hypothetical protein